MKSFILKSTSGENTHHTERQALGGLIICIKKIRRFRFSYIDLGNIFFLKTDWRIRFGQKSSIEVEVSHERYFKYALDFGSIQSGETDDSDVKKNETSRPDGFFFRLKLTGENSYRNEK